ncbi:MAG: aldehyde dehydrogenase family protein, partial [Chloroflexota bacterium]
MTNFAMTIDGHPAAGEKTFGVINPATGSVFAEAPECSKAQLDSAMDAAGRAFKTWKHDENQRRQALRDCATALKGRASELAELLTKEQGKPLKNAIAEINSAAAFFESTADLQIPAEVLKDDERQRIELRRKPFGVVAAITPWNFPVVLAVWKIAPALLAGNTVILKPSPFTPLSSLMLGEILSGVLPRGVFNVVSGGDELGAWITAHPVVRKISFTGSVATGKKIAATAAPDLKRVTLELGGNDPAIVLKDVDVKKVAKSLFWSAFSNTGQVCTAVKRLYVEEDIYPALLDEMAAVAASAKVGDGMDPATRLGPINNRPQFARVIDLVEDAKKAGARIVTGGGRIGDAGYFYPATIVTDISDGARLVDEEQFGPALPIMPFKNIDEA